MKEKIYKSKKNGMAVLIIMIVLYAAAIAGMVFGGIGAEAGNSTGAIVLFVISCVWVCVGFIPIFGLKVLRPQEALVLTLFGKYVGTLRGDGFYFVNPFCVAVNPAAKTKLNQSGDVTTIKKLATNSEQGFEVHRMKKPEIKRFLALYFEASQYGDALPDVDGAQYFDEIYDNDKPDDEILF